MDPGLQMVSYGPVEIKNVVDHNYAGTPAIMYAGGLIVIMILICVPTVCLQVLIN